MCSPQDDFILVFSTGMKNSCKHGAFPCPGVRQKHLGSHRNLFSPWDEVGCLSSQGEIIHENEKLISFWNELTPG